MQNSAALKTEYRNFFSAYVLDDTARQRFVSALHHSNTGDHRGNMIRLILETVEVEEVKEETETMEDKPSANTYASKDIEKIIDFDASAFDMPAIYVGVNNFCGFRRKSQNCYSINGFFIDLDGHNLSEMELGAELIKAKQILNDAFNDGTLLIPSKITRTGRGYGIFYILDRSIATKVPQTEKLRKYFDFNYKMLLKAYTAVLERGGSKLEVDSTVTDRSRVCRLPDTYNYRAGAMCRLYDTPDVFYTLDQIKTGCHLEDYAIKDLSEYHKSLGYDNGAKKYKDGEKTGEGLHKSKIVDFTEYRVSNMLNARIRAIYALQQYFNDHGKKVGDRESLCFLLYNCLVQIKERSKAKEQVREFNQGFLDPIPEKRLVCQSFASVDKEGCYTRLTNDWIISKLKIDYEIANECGLLVSHKTEEREKAKEITAQKRKGREDIILSLKTAFPDVKREDLLQLINVRLSEEGLRSISMRTLDRILKKLGYGREGTLAYDKTAEYKAEQKRKADRLAAKVKKLPNCVREYCSVRGADAPAELVSESMGAVADTKSLLESSGGVADDADRSVVADILSSFVGISGNVVQGVLVGQLRFSDRMVSTMVDAYEQLSTGMRIRMMAGLKLLSAVYMQSGDSSMLMTALNTMSLGITGTGRKHVDIQIGDDVVPYAVYRTGLIEPYSEWKAERDLERTRAEEQEAYDKQMQELQDAEDRYFEIMVRHMERLDVEPESETRFGWLQMMSKDTGSKYHDIANVYRYLQINLKQSSSYADGCYRVGDAIYRGRDLWTALDCITLEDLKDTPIPGYDEAYDQVKDCPYEDFSAMAPDPVEWSDLVVLVVQHWLEIGKQHGGSDLEHIQCSHPRKITTVAKYVKRA